MSKPSRTSSSNFNVQKSININDKYILHFYSSITGNFQEILLTCKGSPKIPGKATNSSSCLFLEWGWQRSMLSSSEVGQFREAEHEWMSLEGFQVRASLWLPCWLWLQPGVLVAQRRQMCSHWCSQSGLYSAALSAGNSLYSLRVLSFPVYRCSLAMQELVPTRPLKLL